MKNALYLTILIVLLLISCNNSKNKISYPKESIKQIADYIYDNQIEEPIWFKDHYKQRGKNRK